MMGITLYRALDIRGGESYIEGMMSPVPSRKSKATAGWRVAMLRLLVLAMVLTGSAFVPLSAQALGYPSDETSSASDFDRDTSDHAKHLGVEEPSGSDHHTPDASMMCCDLALGHCSSVLIGLGQAAGIHAPPGLRIKLFYTCSLHGRIPEIELPPPRSLNV